MKQVFGVILIAAPIVALLLTIFWKDSNGDWREFAKLTGFVFGGTALMMVWVLVIGEWAGLE